MATKRKQSAAEKKAHSNRAPRSLRRKVKRALRRATLTRIGTVATGEDGKPSFMLGGLSDTSQGKSLYLWRAALPGGHYIECLVDRPIRIDEQSFFPVLVDSIAAAIHRGAPLGGILLRYSPEKATALAVDGETGARASAVLAVARLLQAMAPSQTLSRRSE